MIHTVAEAEEALRTYIPRTPLKDHYTLDRMQAFLESLGDPQEKVRVVHIAGTSGKTSAAYFIRGLLQASGARTGLTVSPHMVSVTERLQIDGAPVSDAAFVKYVNDFLPLVEKSGLRPTYFEIIIALAFWVFAREGVDFAIIETGLGGLLDATNTVRRTDKMCVITDIGLDHTDILGETIPEIAAQKAGIIQPGNIAVVQNQPPEALDVITRIADEQHATLHIAHTAAGVQLPPFQQRNFGVALAAYTQLGRPAPTQKQIAAVALQTPPGRLEIYEIAGKTVILDGAHNAQKLQALREALQARGVAKTAVMVNMVAAPRSKIDAALHVLREFATDAIVPAFTIAQDFSNRYPISPADFAERATDVGIATHAEPDVAAALHALLARPETTVVITGSLYLVQAVRPLLRDLT